LWQFPGGCGPQRKPKKNPKQGLLKKGGREPPENKGPQERNTGLLGISPGGFMTPENLKKPKRGLKRGERPLEKRARKHTFL